MSEGMLKKQAVKRYVMDRVALLRPYWDCRQFSASAYPVIEAEFRVLLDRMIERQPTLGKTFKPELLA